MRYLSQSAADVEAMLADIGVGDVEQLFDAIPENLRRTPEQPLPLPSPLDERALLDDLDDLARHNDARVPFLGAGAYPHHVPPAVDQLLLRSEFYTAYTPYQPEVSQGTLQAIFEFQSFTALLAGLDVANSSLYDAATAAAEAARLACRVHRGQGAPKTVAVARSLSPACRDVLRASLSPLGVGVREVDFDHATGQLDLASLNAALEGAAALLVGYPNFFGVIEPLDRIAEVAHSQGALAVSVTEEAVALGLLTPPGRLGADVAVGSMQSFGSPLSFGGPGLGFLAAREAFLRQIPGRIVGATVDRRGRPGYVLTLATREQHIRREKATSNICSNHGLNALAATVHLALLGRHGLRRLARLNYERARYAREALRRAGVPLLFSGPSFNEFAVAGPPAEIAAKLAKARISGGLPLDQEGLGLDGALFCVTELHGKNHIDALVRALSH